MIREMKIKHDTVRDEFFVKTKSDEQALRKLVIAAAIQNAEDLACALIDRPDGRSAEEAVRFFFETADLPVRVM